MHSCCAMFNIYLFHNINFIITGFRTTSRFCTNIYKFSPLTSNSIITVPLTFLQCLCQGYLHAHGVQMSTLLAHI
jgi:hypothetical protein